MRLLTHNLLMCNAKNCKGGFPLDIELADGEMEEPMAMIEVEFQPEFIKNMLNKIEWPALVEAAKKLGTMLPPTYEEKDKDDENFLKAVHTAIQEIDVLEGALVCPKCSRKYPLQKGIPNMLLHDDEV